MKGPCCECHALTATRSHTVLIATGYTVGFEYGDALVCDPCLRDLTRRANHEPKPKPKPQAPTK
jgi:hypothetical protein